MLKNKKERQKFLENNHNWLLMHDLKDTVGMRIYKIDFDDDTTLLKFTHFAEDMYSNVMKEICEGYRVLNQKKNSLTFNVFSISYCVNYIAKRELKINN